MKTARTALLAAALLPAAAAPARAQADYSALVRSTRPAVVTIYTWDTRGLALGQGTGFFVTADGELITNHHVLERAARAEVRTAGGDTYPITAVLGDDRAADLVRARVDLRGRTTPALPLAPLLPEVGSPVVVIGSPLGLEQTVSDGIVSAIREVPGRGRAVQISAPVSPGSSGSPVLSPQGDVVAVVTGIFQGGQNLNLAAPATRARQLAGRPRSLREWAGTARDPLPPVALTPPPPAPPAPPSPEDRPPPKDEERAPAPRRPPPPPPPSAEELREWGVRDGVAAANQRGMGGWYGGGFWSGAAVPLLGPAVTWGIAATSRSSLPPELRVQVERREPAYRDAFEQAYHRRVASRRRSAAVTGGIVGTLVGLLAYALLPDEEEHEPTQ